MFSIEYVGAIILTLEIIEEFIFDLMFETVDVLMVDCSTFWVRDMRDNSALCYSLYIRASGRKRERKFVVVGDIVML